MKVEILDNGLFSIVVDSGRIGRQQDGFCQSGPMDEDAYSWANFMAYNPDNTPCIEAIGSVTLNVSSACVIAVTGRTVFLKVNEKHKAPYQSVFVESGDKIQFGSESFGSKAYLAIGGAWHVSHCVDSACTVQRESLGGLAGDGSPIKKAQQIEIHEFLPSQEKRRKLRRLDSHHRPDYDLGSPIRVVPGYQYDHFSHVAQRILVSSQYKVTSSIDRMGYRLSGPEIACKIQNMRSEAIHVGAIQVPPDGQPIVMMRDRQTLGGYPKVGCINPLDVNRLAQAVPGEEIHFSYQDHEAARADNLLALSRRRQLQGEML
ncbi:biotin-dependent carboxyltransferase family protein [Alteromonas gracilis]|uniref:5-oxoprolinase subunit C family protein n=1 Tax=Alteromonas gracilis TaxID=1479524 RepID=UPI0030D2F17D